MIFVDNGILRPDDIRLWTDLSPVVSSKESLGQTEREPFENKIFGSSTTDVTLQIQSYI